MQIAHLLYLVLDSQHENPLFRAPISEHAQYILDVGCGNEDWAIDCADRFPNLVVHGVDLYPPPQTSVPPNCILEVDDVGKPRTWQQKWDLIRMGHLIWCFSDKGWEDFYRQAYNNLQPGGWIEQLEVEVGVNCDDNTFPADSILNHSTFRDFIHAFAFKADRPITTATTMRDAVSSAGFANIHVHDYKAPIGNWAKHKTYKDAGKVTMEMWKTALEGWLIYLLTKFGVGEGGEDVEPMSWDEAQAWLERVRLDLAKG